MQILVALALLLCLPGCATMNAPPDLDMPETAAVQPPPGAGAPAPAAPTGSLFSRASYQSPFESRRARAVGDLVTVQIVERISASQKSQSRLAREGSMGAGIEALPLLGESSNAKLAARARLGLQSGSAFQGNGATSSDQTFSGSISATVTEVLPNGHLRIRGEKQIGLNHNAEVLRFSGTLDPRTLRPGNVVSSPQLADVRVQARGLGQADAMHAQGWLARFFSGFALF